MTALLLALTIFTGDTMQIKPGVQLGNRLWGAAIKIEAAQHIVAPDTDCVITSRFEGKHRVGSLHYSGDALDFRTRDLSSAQQHIWVALIEESLGKHWDVVLEDDHLHVEFDPK
jgi:hypothetical protein